MRKPPTELSWWKASNYLIEGERWTEVPGALGQLPGPPGLPLVVPSRSRSELRRWGGILLVPSVPWKSPASASTREKAVDRRHPAGRLLACRKRPWAPRGLTSAVLQGGARLSVKLTLQGKALKAQLYKGTGNAA